MSSQFYYALRIKLVPVIIGSCNQFAIILPYLIIFLPVAFYDMPTANCFFANCFFANCFSSFNQLVIFNQNKDYTPAALLN
jgi:hypothetical protein